MTEVKPVDIDHAVMALLQCTSSELGDYSPKLLDQYRADVTRVLESQSTQPSRECLQQSADSCGNCFEGKSDLDHVCRKCGGRGTAACNLDKPPSHVDNAPFGFSHNEASAWSTGYEHGYENACEDFYWKGISNAS